MKENHVAPGWPKKSEKNGYHYYSYAQISSFYFISTFVDGMFGGGSKEYLAWRGRSALDGLLTAVTSVISEAAKESGAADRELSEIQKTAGTDRQEGRIQESGTGMSQRRFFR